MLFPCVKCEKLFNKYACKKIFLFSLLSYFYIKYLGNQGLHKLNFCATIKFT